MKTNSRWCLVVVALMSFQSIVAHAGDNRTIISVPSMHCMSCAKKITAQLGSVPGVASVQVNMEAKALIVQPQAQTVPSARAQWEAVEKAGYQPSRLQGPNGTFASKPSS